MTFRLLTSVAEFRRAENQRFKEIEQSVFSNSKIQILSIRSFRFSQAQSVTFFQIAGLSLLYTLLKYPIKPIYIIGYRGLNRLFQVIVILK